MKDGRTYPNAETQEIQISFSVDRIPAKVRVTFLYQLRVGLQPASGQVDCYLLQVVLPGRIGTLEGDDLPTRYL